MKTIYAKLLNAKKNFSKIHKNAKNPHYKSSYTDLSALLDAIEPILLDNGLLILQPVLNGKVITQIIDVETGDKIESILELDGNLNPQQRGSQITYYRRYSLQSLLSLSSEDDDANIATQNIKPKKQILTDKAFEQAVNRILAGESNLIEKVKQTYELSSKQSAELDEIVKSI